MTTLKNQGGFTLIEVIVVMVVLGVLAAVGSFGLERAMDGYNLAQANAESTQKAQNAVDRITIELANITYNGGLFRYNVTAGTANSITYIANFGGVDETCTINQSDSQAQLVKTVANVMIGTFPLTDLVPANGLLFTYFDGNGNAVPATNADMRLIGIALTVQVIPGVTRTYNARVALQR
jgi:prepilin-type N-terminal cleavage/methylation domain-containing protein